MEKSLKRKNNFDVQTNHGNQRKLLHTSNRSFQNSIQRKKKIKIISQIDKNTSIYKNCPYIGTIRRNLLDFDFEKLCSVTLSNMNVYACLICGKYYQGRGKNSHAYFHSLEKRHHLFINLHNSKIYCLPDNYQVSNKSLNDIKYNLNPYYTKEQVAKLDQNNSYKRSLSGTNFLPGLVGLNNIKTTDYINVIIQTLCRIPDLRNYFIFH